MPWVEIPSHRILQISLDEFIECFEILDAKGQPINLGQEIYRIVRKRDGMQFVVPRYHRTADDQGRVIFLEPYFG